MGITHPSDVAQTPPILQAAIMHKAPPRVIKSIVQNLDCIGITDSMGRYPIDVAIEHKMKWNKGMKEVVEAFSVSKSCSWVHVCAKHGLQWENGMEVVVLEESDADDIPGREDSSSGLYPFMVAATGPKYDLNVVFELTKRSPSLAKIHYNIFGMQ